MTRSNKGQEHHVTDSKVLYAHVETEEILTKKNGRYRKDTRASIQSNTARHKSMDNTASPHFRYLDQSNRTRLRTTATETINAGEDFATESGIQLQDEPRWIHRTTHKIVEDEMLYQLEQPKATRIWRLQWKVISLALGAAIIVAAYHVTPLARHTCVCKAYWRIAARFWWSEMSRDIRKAVLDCAQSSPTSARSAVYGRTLRCNKYGRMISRTDKD